MKNINNDFIFYKDKINYYLEKFFNRKITDANKISEFARHITQSLTDYTMRGGKRLRPILFLYGYEAAGRKVDNSTISLAIFLELIQSSLIIHDDVIDNSDLRRGKETIHKEYTTYLYKTDSEFGRSLAIVIGDVAINYAYEIIADARISMEQKNILIKAISDFTNQVNFGQAMDVLFSKNDTLTLENIKKVNYHKTVTYTTLMPLVTGAALAQAKPKVIKCLSNYAINLGLAFQILDDIMGVFGEAKETGKSTMSDIIEGKKTLLIFKALECAENKDKKYIHAMLGNKKITQQEYEKLKQIIYKTGSLDYSIAEANKLIEQAILKIKNSDIADKMQQKLINLALFVLHKDKINLNFRRKI